MISSFLSSGDCNNNDIERTTNETMTTTVNDITIEKDDVAMIPDPNDKPISQQQQQEKQQQQQQQQIRDEEQQTRDFRDTFKVMTKLSYIHFMSLWRPYLQRLKWKWNSSQYYAPDDGKVPIGSSKDVSNFLDLPLMNGQERRRLGFVVEEGLVARACRLRDELLDLIYDEFFNVDSGVYKTRLKAGEADLKQYFIDYYRDLGYDIIAPTSTSRGSGDGHVMTKLSVNRNDVIVNNSTTLKTHMICDVCSENTERFLRCEGSCGLIICNNNKCYPTTTTTVNSFTCDVCRSSPHNSSHNNNDDDDDELNHCEAKSDGRHHPSHIQCLYCHRTDVRGGMKHYKTGHDELWMHMTCYNTTLTSTKESTPKTTTTIELRKELDACGGETTCESCNRSVGLLHPCDVLGCRTVLHPLCAAITQRAPVDKKDSKKSKNYYRRYKCATHSYRDSCIVCHYSGYQSSLLTCETCRKCYHRRCAGVDEGSVLMGEWFCAECRTTTTGRQSRMNTKAADDNDDDDYYENGDEQERRRADASAMDIDEGARRYFTKKTTKKTKKQMIEKRKERKRKGLKRVNAENIPPPQDRSYGSNTRPPHTADSDATLPPSSQPSIIGTSHNSNTLLVPPSQTIPTLQSLPFATHEHETSCLLHSYRHHYPEWRFLLSTNHSLLCHGFGSKRDLLNDFALQELCAEGDYVIIDGYDEDVTMDGILDVLEYHVGYYGDDGGGVLERAKALAEFMSRPDDEGNRDVLFLIIHNIDAVALRDVATQNALVTLVEQSVPMEEQEGGCGSRRIRLVASVDDVDAVMWLWDVRMVETFNWIWKQTTTYHRYINEIQYGIFPSDPQTTAFQKSKSLIHTDESILNVLQSLANRHSEVLRELSTLQLAAAADSGNSGNKAEVEYRTLLSNCQKKMYVTSDSNLRVMMKELVDHNIVSFGRRDGGVEVYFVMDAKKILMLIDKLKI